MAIYPMSAVEKKRLLHQEEWERFTLSLRLRHSVEKVFELLPEGDVNSVDLRGRTTLMFAARIGRLDVVSILLPRVDAKAVDKSGLDALMAAAIGGHESVVSALLPHSDTKAVNSYGDTAADIAESLGHHKCAQIIRSCDTAQDERKELDLMLTPNEPSANITELAASGKGARL